MKRVLRHFVIDTFSLWVASNIAGGIEFNKGIQSLIFTGIGLTCVSLLAKPVINILLLPINLVTFGVFRWISSAIVLYIVTLIIKDFKIIKFIFNGYSSKWFDIPSMNFNGVLAFVGFAFIISIITSFIYWLIK